MEPNDREITLFVCPLSPGSVLGEVYSNKSRWDAASPFTVTLTVPALPPPAGRLTVPLTQGELSFGPGPLAPTLRSCG